ncbi:DNA-directed RNA polymerase III subunit RPC4 isoform X3 [Maniola jurtina]|uniref:DNA-directed RNA polymerase III subunit RPC4 isoform X3 n=1 Tax=Maniola jurtina TaxID=191418 RepID=UPI001E688849|nr:DNA-directed RNA polymerase III subunit RPC4 isoform X3 [Maniola jurtina]
MSNLGEKSNTNGLGTDPLQRLASLKPPRDLSLGGMKPNRKIFTPNLNVARNKNKGPSTASSRDQNRDDRHRKDLKNDKNRNFKNGPKIIKSTGVFSEGLGSAERHTSSRVSYGRESEGTPTLQRPTIRVKDVIKIDKELEEQKIKAAFGDSTSYEDASEDFKTILDIEAPVKLPMDNGVTNVHPKPPLVDVKEVFEENNVADLLRSDKPALILLQLADTLPGRGGGGDDARPSTSAEEGGGDKPQVDNRCRLADLEEGKIGKLRVHRSGRVTLALGDTIFEVCAGTKASFHQEVVSVAADDASRSACMVSLGALTHKLNVTPHWRDMFHNMSL